MMAAKIGKYEIKTEKLMEASKFDDKEFFIVLILLAQLKHTCDSNENSEWMTLVLKLNFKKDGTASRLGIEMP